MSDDVTMVRDQMIVTRMPHDLSPPMGTPINLCPGSLPRDEAGVIARMNAQGQSTLELDRDGCLLLSVQDWLIYPRETLDEESGELKQYGWVVLIDPHGERWGTSSPVVAGKVAQLAALRSAGLLTWPVCVQIVTRTARKTARRYHDLIVLAPEALSRESDSAVAAEPPNRNVARRRNAS